MRFLYLRRHKLRGADTKKMLVWGRRVDRRVRFWNFRRPKLRGAGVRTMSVWGRRGASRRGGRRSRFLCLRRPQASGSGCNTRMLVSGRRGGRSLRFVYFHRSRLRGTGAKNILVWIPRLSDSERRGIKLKSFGSPARAKRASKLVILRLFRPAADPPRYSSGEYC